MLKDLEVWEFSCIFTPMKKLIYILVAVLGMSGFAQGQTLDYIAMGDIVYGGGMNISGVTIGGGNFCRGYYTTIGVQTTTFKDSTDTGLRVGLGVMSPQTNLDRLNRGRRTKSWVMSGIDFQSVDGSTRGSAHLRYAIQTGFLVIGVGAYVPFNTGEGLVELQSRGVISVGVNLGQRN